MPIAKRKKAAAAPAIGKPGDWREAGAKKPQSHLIPLPTTDYEKDAYKDLEGSKTSAIAEALRAIETGKAVVDDAILFCGRFDRDGRLLRESGRGLKAKPYRLVRLRGHGEYREAMSKAGKIWAGLPKKAAEAQAKLAKRREARARLRGQKFREDFTSSSDLGSTNTLDPNQFTEFTPFFNGPHQKQQYFDYFKGHSRAFEHYNHNPVAKRIIDILVQYALGRGFQVRCRNEKLADGWRDFVAEHRIVHKLRKYWGREYLIYGENFIDVLRWTSVDPSTIYDIICEGYDEHIDQVLYYQQMFQTATQMYAGINVPGVPGSRDSKSGHYIIRQIPYDQIIHIKTNVVSVEKRGRSVLYSILGWLKRLTDLYNAQVLGEQLRASFVWDDTIKGDDADVAAHGAKYDYIPVAPSIFVHNDSVERKPLAPLSGVTGNGTANVGQEILAVIATAVGLPKEHLNIMAQGGGNRATAIVGSEPFTKVVEDLQADFDDLIHLIIERYCVSEGAEYDSQEWEVIFPSVVKDTTLDRLKAIATCESMHWFAPRRAATMAAAEMEADGYEYEAEMAKAGEDEDEKSKAGLLDAGLQQPPAGRLGGPSPGLGDRGGSPNNPVHGKGKQDIQDQHKDL